MNKKKRRKRILLPRLGPPQNLRPAGAHESKKHYNRKRHKAALERYEEGGFVMTVVAALFSHVATREGCGCPLV